MLQSRSMGLKLCVTNATLPEFTVLMLGFDHNHKTQYLYYFGEKDWYLTVIFTFLSNSPQFPYWGLHSLVRHSFGQKAILVAASPSLSTQWRKRVPNISSICPLLQPECQLRSVTEVGLTSQMLTVGDFWFCTCDIERRRVPEARLITVVPVTDFSGASDVLLMLDL